MLKMKVAYENISAYGVQFKQLISGPAPVGRVLNYIKLAGEGCLKHRNGNRDLYLKNNIASAWCSEFMVGLGLVYYIEELHVKISDLKLTAIGKEIYELIKNSSKFDESSDPSICLKQLKDYSVLAYDKFFESFKNSVVCKNLCKYIVNNGTNKYNKYEFKDDYFGTFKYYYTGEEYLINGVGASTGSNRVPSLIQFCQFFDCMKTDREFLVFDYAKLKGNVPDVSFIPIDFVTKEKIIAESQWHEKLIEDLVDKYGISGTIAREMVVRNSEVQSLFRNNLFAKYGVRCAVCGKTIEKVLIASHIKPASKCDVIEKANCENGIVLCALHDKLFDRYLITFDCQSGKLIYAEILKEKLKKYQLEQDFCLPQEYLTKERKTFLKYHNKVFFDKNHKT